MPESRTHYQVSFTSRQAVLLFVGALVALAVAYFLGLATGIAGRQAPESAAITAPAPAPTAPAAARKVTAASAVSRAAQAPGPSQVRTPLEVNASREAPAAGRLQFFEDRPEETAGGAPPEERASAPASAPGGFLVQILSTTSEREARSRTAVLSSRGYRASVEPIRRTRGPTLYRVRVGPYASRDEAAKVAERLVRQEKVKPWIVPPGE